MAVKIRLRRMGQKKAPFYRIVVADCRNREIIPDRFKICGPRKGRARRYVMKQLVEVIAKSLVENPDEVVVTETEKDDAIVVELKVGPADMGKVIGRQGRIAKAIRTVVKAASSKSSKKVIVDILQ